MSIARRLRDPLPEVAALFNSDRDILSLKLHEYQVSAIVVSNIGGRMPFCPTWNTPVFLFFALSFDGVLVVRWCGVCIAMSHLCLVCVVVGLELTEF